MAFGNSNEESSRSELALSCLSAIKKDRKRQIPDFSVYIEDSTDSDSGSDSESDRVCFTQLPVSLKFPEVYSLPLTKRKRSNNTTNLNSHGIHISANLPPSLQEAIKIPVESEIIELDPETNDSSSVPTALNFDDWTDWVSGSQLRNYILKDPCLDFLAMYGVKKGFLPITEDRNYTNDASFTHFIMNQGTKFETEIIAKLVARFPRDIKFISETPDSRSYEKYIKTLETIRENRVPMIYQAVLRNYTDSTYGSPDLLVKRSFLKQICPQTNVEENFTTLDAFSNSNYTAEGIGTGYSDLMLSSKNTTKDHYVIVDIKFCTLHLKANGTTLLNEGSAPAYKAQMALYNRALGQMQKILPTTAYILGRRWEYTKRGQTYKGSSAFERLGVIDFAKDDAHYYTLVDSAVNWRRDLKRNGHNWKLYNEVRLTGGEEDLTIPPLSRYELYPNMHNDQDYPWHSVKKEINSNINDITSLWNCGTKQREIAHSKGIYSWRDLRCTASALEVNGEHNGKILQQILDTNHFPYLMGPVYPKAIKNNDRNWRFNSDNLEFFVDFETVNDINDNFAQLPYAGGQHLVFMIGCGHSCSKTPVFEPTTAQRVKQFGSTSQESTRPLNSLEVEPLVPPKAEPKWVFRSFTVNELTLDEEFRIFDEFFEYMNGVYYQFYYNTPPNLCPKLPLVYHWSKAECTELKGAISRQLARNIPVNTRKINTYWFTPNWFDALDLFHKEPITVLGATNFGLKQIARSMHALGLIETSWVSSNVDGIKAMVTAWNLQKELQAKPDAGSLQKFPQMQEIIKYNEVDCRVIWEIIEYLRKNHNTS